MTITKTGLNCHPVCFLVNHPNTEGGYSSLLKEYLQKKQNEIDDFLDKNLPIPADNKPSSIFEAMRYSIFAGGKRIRPIISFMVTDMLKGDSATLYPSACAIELIHTYSLIHDDLPALDNDDLRRGKPSSHKQFGEAMAILAGDSLLTLAFQWIGTANHRAEVTVAILNEVSYAAGVWGMIGGQVADIESEGRLKRSAEIKYSKADNEKELEYIHKHKTAALIRASVVIGALISNVSKEKIEQCRQLGTSLGLAFQVADDILDIEGEEQSLGKSVGKDIKANKLTYPALYGLESAKAKAKALIAECKTLIKKLNGSELLYQFADMIIERKN